MDAGHPHHRADHERRIDQRQFGRLHVGGKVHEPHYTEFGVLIIPVLEEVLVVEKRLVLKEELHVRRLVSEENVEIPVTVRKQRAVVERVTPEGLSNKENEEKQ